MQKVFLDSGERGGNHKKKVGSNVGAALSTLDATDGRHNDVKAATDNMASIGTTNTSNTSSEPVLNAMQHGVEYIATKANFPSTYATKLSLTSSTKENHRKLEANVPNDADYNVWLPLDPVHELSSIEGVDSVLRDGTWIIREILIFLNKWSPSDKGKGRTSGANDEGFIGVKRKKSGGNNGGNIDLKMVLVKPKTHYRPKVKQSTQGTSNFPKTTPLAGTNNASTSCYNKESPSNKGNGLFSLSNSFEALNVEGPIIEEVTTSNKATILGKLVLVDDDRKPIDKVDYAGNTGSEDKVEPIDNETTSFLGIKTNGVGYGIRSLFKQWRDAVVDDDYDPYDDDMYEGHEILKNIQTICDNFDIKVRGRKKK
ncbi:hypothetical protein Tco_0793041 [Tanacetum coccineum]